MPTSHGAPEKTTSLLVLMAVVILTAHQPAWLTVSTADAARALGVHPSYVSRLAGRFLTPARTLLATLTRRGRRPARGGESAAARALRKTQALLETAAALVRSPRAAVRPLVLGAFVRMHAEYGISKTEFCNALGLSERTFRAWRGRHAAAAVAPTPAPAPTPPAKPKKRGPRRPRLHFDVFVPDVQFGADTTDLHVFGVDLKLVGLQDIGGRDRSLFDAVVVDTTESADHVKKAFETVLAACPGAQTLTDQGTPYMAQATVDLFNALDVEHAPQREGHPQGKATVERGFLSLKAALAPLVDLTNFLAARFPLLRDPSIAVPFTRLATAVALRAHQAGARAARRADDARGGVDEDALVRAAARAREDARAEDRSVRLWLSQLHAQLRFPGSLEAFVRDFRRVPLEALKDAERDLRKRLIIKDDIRDLWRYFAVLARNARDALFRERDARDAAQALAEQRRRDDARADTERRAFLEDPVRWLHVAFDLIALHWHRGELLFDGVGPGSGNLAAALGHLAATRGAQATVDITRVVLDEFLRARHHEFGHDGARALSAVVERHLAALRRFADDVGVADSLRGAIPTRSRGDPSQLSR
jgi:hypothetical protein